MAKCTECGKTTTFGQSRPWSNKATKRQFKANLQKVAFYENGRKVQKVLCTRCMRTQVKTSKAVEISAQVVCFPKYKNGGCCRYFLLS